MTDSHFYYYMCKQHAGAERLGASIITVSHVYACHNINIQGDILYYCNSSYIVPMHAAMILSDTAILHAK